MNYNFDKINNRRISNSIKWNPELYGNTFNKNTNLIPFWIADMDFEVAKEIKNRLKLLVEHGIWGYAGLEDTYFNSIINWYQKNHNWKIKREEIVYTPGIVPAISYLIETFSNQDDSILIFTPVYYPFKTSIKTSKRKLVECPLIKDENNYYSIDFLKTEELIIKEQVKILIFCSPHNPVGRVWKKEELKKLGEICLKHKVLIISDEIHSDLVFFPNKHTPFLEIGNTISKICIVCNAATKTFNLAGLPVSNVIIKNKILRNSYLKTLEKYGVVFPNVFAIEAAKTAYNEGYTWYIDMLNYIEQNINFIDDFIKRYIPFIKFRKPEGTYLGWLDFSYYDLIEEDFKRIFEKELEIAIDYGFWFGKEGSNFIRLNFACPRSLLEKAFEKIKSYFNNIEKH